jgi:hypothetical protein
MPHTGSMEVSASGSTPADRMRLSESSRKLPEVTTSSPSSRPSRICTRSA